MAAALLGLLALALLPLCAAGPLQPLSIKNVIYSNDGTGGVVFAPGAELDGRQLEVTAAESPEQCALACRTFSGNETCGWAAHCNFQGGCNQTTPHLDEKECRLYAPMSKCSGAVPLVQSDRLMLLRSVAFPVRDKPPRDVVGFSTSVATGIWDAQLSGFECQGSTQPGACAFASLQDALHVCTYLQAEACRSVVWYTTGFNDCSEPIAVLQSDPLTPENGFVAPTVHTFIKLQSRSMGASLLASGNSATTTLATKAEEAAARANPSSNTSWLGCITLEGKVVNGEPVDVVDNIASPDACCRACRLNPDCTVWNWCPRPEGCRYDLVSSGGNPDRLASFAGNSSNGAVLLKHMQCELRFQEAETVQMGWPLAVLADNVSFISGSPLSIAAPDIPGYSKLPGKAPPFVAGSLACPQSIKPYLNECILDMPVQELAGFCDADPKCTGFQYKEGWPGNGGPVGIMQSTLDINAMVVVSSSVVYIRDALPGVAAGPSHGLSTGAVVGIVVGAVIGTAVLGFLAWRLMRRWQRNALAVPADCESDLDTVKQSEIEPSPAASSQLLPPHAALKLVTASGPTAGSPSRAAALTGTASQPPAHAALPVGCVAPMVLPMPSPFEGHAAIPFQTSAAATATSPQTSREQSSSCPILAGDCGGSGGTAGTAGTGGSDERFPSELAQHVAALDAVLSTSQQHVSQQHVSQTPSVVELTTRQSLPAALKEWVVAMEAIEYWRWPNGQLQELGAGASGKVVKAMYRGEVVAAKLIDLGVSTSSRDAFITEAVRLHQLRHPNVVTLYGVAVAGSTGVLLMEYCAFRDLSSALQVRVAGSEERLFSWQRRGRRAALQVATALNFLHSRGIVHMDVKSNNVLLASSGVAKLADVGLSRLQQNTYLSDVPVIGTFAWIAPEVLMGGQQCTSAVDIFSLGVVLWEIATGLRPVRGSLRPIHVPEEGPQELEELIAECLRLDPSQRPTALQVMQRLERMGGGPWSLGGMG